MSMQKSPPQAPQGGFSVQDVLFILFKHKWKIILFSLLGFAGAAVVYLKQVPQYVSTAKLLVRYVRETGTVDPFSTMKSPGNAPRGVGDPVIATEMEILNSLDLAFEVAEAIGVEKLLPQAPNAEVAAAAGVIVQGLKATPGQSVDAIYVSYGHKDPELSKLVLEKIIEVYFKRHLEIHRSAAAFDLVAKQSEEAQTRLKQTEEKLGKLRTAAGIMNLGDATSALTASRTKTLEDLMTAKTELAEVHSSLNVVEEDSAAEAADKLKAGGTKAGEKTDKLPPATVLTEYKSLMELLTYFRGRDVTLRIKFKPGSRLLLLNQQQIDSYEVKRREMVAKYPALAEETVATPGDLQNPRTDAISRKARVAAIEAKIRVFNEHLKEIGEKFSVEYKTGTEIEALERQRQMEEAEFRALEADLKEAKRTATLDPSRMPNITPLQNPSRPVKTLDDLTQKIILGLAGGGMGIGLGLAFLIELLLDRRVKRPIEIQTRLQLPLLLSIPFIRRKERGGLLLNSDQNVPRIGTGEDLAISNSTSEELGLESSTRKMGHFILPYSETIRDRIIFNFEVNNVTHKPKLVAVTGLSEGAGTSTIAAGLAKSFSEMRGMKVLLVDLSSCHPEESPLFGEIPRHSLNGALHLARNTQFRENPQNLYYASATARRDETGLTTFSPMHLYELMPHLQASQYDYIVFDMPPVDQTSRTLTMAGMMDKVLLVLDAENTSRDGLMWGYSELVKGRADVSCVFNKTRSHVPAWLNGPV